MKNFKLLLLSCIAIISFSCEKDDDMTSEPTTASFTQNEIVYGTNNAFLKNRFIVTGNPQTVDLTIRVNNANIGDYTNADFEASGNEYGFNLELNPNYYPSGAELTAEIYIDGDVVPAETLVVDWDNDTTELSFDSTYSISDLYENLDDQDAHDLNFSISGSNAVLTEIRMYKKITSAPAEDNLWNIFKNVRLFIDGNTTPSDGGDMSDENSWTNDGDFYYSIISIDDANIQEDQNYLFKFTESVKDLDNSDLEIDFDSRIDLVFNRDGTEYIFSSNTEDVEIDNLPKTDINCSEASNNPNSFEFYPNDSSWYNIANIDAEITDTDGVLESIELKLELSNILNAGIDISTMIEKVRIDYDGQSIELNTPSIMSTLGTQEIIYLLDGYTANLIAGGSIDEIEIEIFITDYLPTHPLAGMMVQSKLLTFSGTTNFDEDFTVIEAINYSPINIVGDDHVIVSNVNDTGWYSIGGSLIKRNIVIDLENIGSDTAYITNQNDGFYLELNGSIYNTTTLNMIVGYAIVANDYSGTNYTINEGDTMSYEVIMTMETSVVTEEPEMHSIEWNDADYSGITNF